MSIFPEVRMLRFFDHVTGEPLNVFGDAECSIVHSQPIISTVNGEWPPIFLEGGNWAEKVYEVDCLDRNGKLILRLSPLAGEPRQKSFWWRVLFGP